MYTYILSLLYDTAVLYDFCRFPSGSFVRLGNVVVVAAHCEWSGPVLVVYHSGSMVTSKESSSEVNENLKPFTSDPYSHRPGIGPDWNTV